MGKQTQTICQLLPTNCLSVFDHSVGLALKKLTPVLANIYLFKVNNRNTRRRSGVFIVNFEYISQLIFSVIIVDFEKLNLFCGWLKDEESKSENNVSLTTS